MGIKESNLPIAESLGSGDKLRIVTSEGESKQIGADSVSVMPVMITKDGENYTADKTFDEVLSHLQSGGLAYAVYDSSAMGYSVGFYPCERFSKSGSITFARFYGATANKQLQSIGYETFAFSSDNSVFYNSVSHSFV